MTGVLGLSALASLILCYLLISYTREARTIQGQFLNANMRRNALTGLAGEALEYAKKNPSIIPFLQASGVPTTSLTQGGKPNTR